MATPTTPGRKRSICCIALVSLPLFLGLPWWAAAADSSPDPAVSTAQRSDCRDDHLAALGAGAWHRAGFQGQGVKVAILDSGFRGYRTYLGKELPPRVLARSLCRSGDLEARDSQHGILCAEVIHAIAPDAELLFANWEPDRPDQFLEAVHWARQQGARVISCSVVTPTWSDGEGGGPIHEALTKSLGHEALCFASAGNMAERTWSGSFHDGGDGWHEWAAGRKDNVLLPWGRQPMSVELCWPRDCDYELVVWDATEEVVVGRSAPHTGAGRTCAVVRVAPVAGHSYQVRVRRVDGKTPGRFHLVVLGGGLTLATAPGSIPFPGDGPEVIAVGAVGADGRRAVYSSCGPDSHRPKPDLAAWVPFPLASRPQPFAGTSAAAPQAAALAALLWSRHPDWDASRIRETLAHSAHDLLAPGPDSETGYGLIALPPLK